MTNLGLGDIAGDPRKVQRKMGGGNPAPRQIQITLNKAIPANLVTAANIASGIHYKFSNERLLNFETGNKLDYTTGELKTGDASIGIVTTNTSDGTNAAGAGYSGTPGVTSGFTTSGSGIGGNNVSFLVSLIFF